MEYNNIGYKQYIRDLQDALSQDYLAFPFEELENDPDQDLSASEEEIKQFKELVCRINNAQKIHQFCHIAQTYHRNYEIAMFLDIPDDWKLDSERLFQVLSKLTQYGINRAIKYIDCDNAAILKELNDAIMANDFEKFHKIIKENNINTASLSKVLYLFDTIYDPRVSDFLDAEDELDKIIAWEQFQTSISCCNEINLPYLEGGQDNIDKLNKIVWGWVLGEKLSENIDLTIIINNLKDKIKRFNYEEESESEEDVLCVLSEYKELLEPVILKQLTALMFFNKFSDAENYVISNALTDFGLTSKFEGCFVELKEIWESCKDVLYNIASNTFSVPSDLYSNPAYTSEERSNNHFNGSRIKQQMGPEKLENLINYLALHNYIGNRDTEKYRLLYFLTGRVVNANVDYTGMLSWTGEATVLYNIVKNLYTGKGHYQCIPEIVNFESDKNKGERLNQIYTTKPGEISGYADRIPDDEFKTFAKAAFGWRF